MRKCESNKRTLTEHVVYCAKEEQHKGPCVYADGNGMHFWFDGYEIANLRALFEAIDRADSLSPLAIFKSGDWFQQIKNKITEGLFLLNNSPNKSGEQLLNEFNLIIKLKEGKN